ncbi:hypothetical protein NEDG_00871 [Nematocida displodere]|uniref:Uncharacterized protein n=1 Tax=Nematocida displodere TaxID=1805483 RepID=A0A177ED40_9MICR|nr:hypothetical protein NEDG_00871 [Nematocida displodere]
MKVQLESIEHFEGIFKELLGTGQDETYTQDELDVILHVKSLFLKNVEIAGEELDLGRITQQRLESKKTQTKLISEIETTETEALAKLKELCVLRKDLPESLKKEINKECQVSANALAQDPPARGPPPSAPEPHDGIARIAQTINELTIKLPLLAGTIKEEIRHVESEAKERTHVRGRQIEAESLSLLFKDELELSISDKAS